MSAIYRLMNWIRHAARAKKGDWMDIPLSSNSTNRPTSDWAALDEYKPDAEFDKLAKPAENPVLKFAEALKEGKVEVEEAWLYEACVDRRGKIMKETRLLESRKIAVPYRVRHVTGKEFTHALMAAESTYKRFPARLKRLEESRRKLLDGLTKLKESRLIEDIDFAQDATMTPFDAAQYTEYTPIYGGPFNKQLYITDYLTMHSRAFEAKNHHPLAKRIIDLLAQYSFGRRFKVRWKDSKKEKVWKEFDHQFNIVHRMSEFWIREYLLYGELMIDKSDWQSIDPSTVWDIITEPDDITNVYYYHQTYSTAYQTFTGFRVPGEPGSEKQPGLKFIVRQLPAHQVIHVKGNVVSQEKRGRSILFPILGWLKRVRDLYDAEVVKEQLNACFLWDDTIDGSASDVSNHIAQYARMPTKATVFAHNKAVERKPLNALTSSGRSSGGVADEILSFIATAIGIPKDFFNVMATGGGNRATALVGAEPFEKVIEDIQAKFEKLLNAIAEELITGAGMAFEGDDVEFVFPSVTKDTTSEMIKNIAMGESLGYIDHQAAAEMYAAEMNFTNYDFQTVQDRIDKWAKENPSPAIMPPPGRFGANGAANGNVPDDQSPLHGQPKNNLKGQLKTL